MNWIMIGFIVAAIILYLIIFIINPKNVKIAFSSAIYQLFSLQQGFFYMIVAAFFIASMLILILPKEQIVNLIGPESGIKCMSIGTGLGIITPGGPMLTFPILVAFYKSGAGVGVVVAYLTAWSLLGLQRVLVWEIPFLGPKFVAIRVAVSFLIPIVLGMVAQWIFNFVK